MQHADHGFTFSVMIEYIDIVLAMRETKPEYIDAIRGTYNSFLTVMDNVRRYIDGDTPTPKMNDDFALMMHALLTTGARPIKARATIHKHLLSFVEVTKLFVKAAAPTREQMTAIKRLRDCLAFITDQIDAQIHLASRRASR